MDTALVTKPGGWKAADFVKNCCWLLLGLLRRIF